MYYMKVHVHVYRTLAILEVGRRERQVNPDKKPIAHRQEKPDSCMIHMYIQIDTSLENWTVCRCLNS